MPPFRWFGCALLMAWSMLASGQSAPIVIGFLHQGSHAAYGHLLPLLKAELNSLGWKEGVQLVFEERWANGDVRNLDLLAKQLVETRAKIIVASPNASVMAARAVAPKTPIVMSAAADPVGTGLVKSLARPGGTVTGLASSLPEMNEKYLELLLNAAPKVRRVGFLRDTAFGRRDLFVESATRSARKFGMEPLFAAVSSVQDVDRAVRDLQAKKVDAVIIMPGPTMMVARKHLLELTSKAALPVVGWSREFAADGALLSYGPDFRVVYRRAAHYVDRLLRGAQPAELPVEEPTRIELVLNRKTARLLGLTIPDQLLLRADEVLNE